MPVAMAGCLGACVFGIPVLLSWEQFMALPAGWDVLMFACYLPLGFWGLTVLVVTVDHARRRLLANHPGDGGQQLLCTRSELGRVQPCRGRGGAGSVRL